VTHPCNEFTDYTRPQVQKSSIFVQ